MQPNTPTENDKLLEVIPNENAIPGVVHTTVDFGADPARIDTTNTNGYTNRTAVILTVHPQQADGTFDDNIKIQYLAAKGGDTFFTVYRKLTGDDSAGVAEGARVQCNVDSQWAFLLMQALYNILDKQGNPISASTGALTPQAQAVVDQFIFSQSFQISTTAEVNIVDAATTLDLASAQALTGWVQGSSRAVDSNGDYYLLVRINGDLSGQMKVVDVSNNDTIFALARFTLLGTVGTTKYYFLNQVGDATMPLSYDVTNAPEQVSWEQQTTVADAYKGAFRAGLIPLSAIVNGTPTKLLGYNASGVLTEMDAPSGGGTADGHLTDAVLDTTTNSATFTVDGGTPSIVTLDLSSLSDKVPTGISLGANNVLTMTFDDGSTETVDLSPLAEVGDSVQANQTGVPTALLKNLLVNGTLYDSEYVVQPGADGHLREATAADVGKLAREGQNLLIGGLAGGTELAVTWEYDFIPAVGSGNTFDGVVDHYYEHHNPANNDVVYGRLDHGFFKYSSSDGTWEYPRPQPANIRGEYASETEAENHVNAVGQLAIWRDSDGTYKINRVTAYTPHVDPTYSWQKPQDIKALYGAVAELQARSASDVPVDTSNFNMNLGSGDNNVQAALETLDELVAGGMVTPGTGDGVVNTLTFNATTNTLSAGRTGTLSDLTANLSPLRSKYLGAYSALTDAQKAVIQLGDYTLRNNRFWIAHLLTQARTNTPGTGADDGWRPFDGQFRHTAHVAARYYDASDHTLVSDDLYFCTVAGEYTAAQIPASDAWLNLSGGLNVTQVEPFALLANSNRVPVSKKFINMPIGDTPPTAELVGERLVDPDTLIPYLCVNEPHVTSNGVGTWNRLDPNDQVIIAQARGSHNPQQNQNKFIYETSTNQFFASTEVGTGIWRWISDNPNNGLAIYLSDAIDHTVKFLNEIPGSLDDADITANNRITALDPDKEYFYFSFQQVPHFRKLDVSTFTPAGGLIPHFDWKVIGKTINPDDFSSPPIIVDSVPTDLTDYDFGDILLVLDRSAQEFTSLWNVYEVLGTGRADYKFTPTDLGQGWGVDNGSTPVRGLFNYTYISHSNGQGEVQVEIDKTNDTEFDTLEVFIEDVKKTVPISRVATTSTRFTYGTGRSVDLTQLNIVEDNHAVHFNLEKDGQFFFTANNISTKAIAPLVTDDGLDKREILKRAHPQVVPLIYMSAATATTADAQQIRHMGQIFEADLDHTLKGCDFYVLQSLSGSGYNAHFSKIVKHADDDYRPTGPLYECHLNGGSSIVTINAGNEEKMAITFDETYTGFSKIDIKRGEYYAFWLEVNDFGNHIQPRMVDEQAINESPHSNLASYPDTVVSYIAKSTVGNTINSSSNVFHNNTYAMKCNLYYDAPGSGILVEHDGVARALNDGTLNFTGDGVTVSESGGKSNIAIAAGAGQRGLPGEPGAQGPRGSSVYLQYSANNNSWHDTLVPATDSYLRAALAETQPANDSPLWTAGKRFEGYAGVGSYRLYRRAASKPTKPAVGNEAFSANGTLSNPPTDWISTVPGGSGTLWAVDVFRIPAANNVAVTAVYQLEATDGDDGVNGNTPLLETVTDDARVVFRLNKYLRPDGTVVNALTTQYLADGAFTSNIANAVNIKGEPGAPGQGNAFDLYDDVDTQGTVTSQDRMLIADVSVTGQPNRYVTLNQLKAFTDFRLHNIPDALSNTNIHDDDRVAVSDESESGDPNKYITIGDLKLLFAGSTSDPFKVHDVTTSLSGTAIDNADRFVVSDESVANDPNKYITLANLRAAIISSGTIGRDQLDSYLKRAVIYPNESGVVVPPYGLIWQRSGESFGRLFMYRGGGNVTLTGTPLNDTIAEYDEIIVNTANVIFADGAPPASMGIRGDLGVNRATGRIYEHTNADDWQILPAPGGGAVAAEELYNNFAASTGISMSTAQQGTLSNSPVFNLGRLLVAADDDKDLIIDMRMTCEGTFRYSRTTIPADLFRTAAVVGSSGTSTNNMWANYVYRTTQVILTSFGEMVLSFGRQRASGTDRVKFAIGLGNTHHRTISNLRCRIRLK